MHTRMYVYVESADVDGYLELLSHDEEGLSATLAVSGADAVVVQHLHALGVKA